MPILQNFTLAVLIAINKTKSPQQLKFCKRPKPTNIEFQIY